jgi:hypothetical protein
MRRSLALSLVLLAACKKDPPPTVEPAASATPPASGAPAATTVAAAAPAAPTFSPRFSGSKLRPHPLDTGLLIESDEIFYSLDEAGLHQLKDLRRGTKGKSRDLTFLGSSPDCLFAVGNSVADGETRRVWASFRRSGDFWGETSYDGDSFLSGAVPVGQDRWVGFVAVPNEGNEQKPTEQHTFDTRLVLACGKGPFALPSLASPVSTAPAPASAAPSASASAARAPAPSSSVAPAPAPASSGSAAPSSSGSAAAGSAAASAMASAAPAPAEAPTAAAPSPEAPPPATLRCPKRTHPWPTVPMARQLASSPAGDLFLVGSDCVEASTAKTREATVVERWKAGSRQSVVDVLPEPSGARVSLVVQSSDVALAYGSVLASGGQLAYLAVFDSGSWTHDVPPSAARLVSATFDQHGTVWVVNADGELWRRTGAQQWTKITLPGAAGKALEIAAFGPRLWVVTETTIFADGPPAPVLTIDKVVVDKIKGSDYWDFGMGPLCSTPYVKVGAVRNPKAELEKEFPGLVELAKANGGATEAVWEDRGGQQWLGLRAKSREAADKIVQALVAADPKAKAKAICNDPRGAFVKKRFALDQ